MSNASALACIHCGHLVEKDVHGCVIHITGPDKGWRDSAPEERHSQYDVDHYAETY